MATGEEVSDPLRSTTDNANAKRFVAQHGDQVRWCAATKEWLTWEGYRWIRGDEGFVMRRARETAARIWDESNEAFAAGQTALAKALRSHAQKTDNLSGMRAMVEYAKIDLDIVVKPAMLDADLWALNCINGVVDLRTGVLRKHRREDLITKLCPVEYDLHATHPAWDQFLRDATGGDEEFISFLAEAVGYSLTGSTREEYLFFIHGPGRSGKTTFIEAIKAMLGDYAKTARFETLLKKPATGGANNDIAELAWARFVSASESDEGRPFSAALVKLLTGGERVNARHLFKESFEFTPRFKLWLASNFRPPVSATDKGMWRRIQVIPFAIECPEEKVDRTLKDTLLGPALPAVLAWAVRGCLRWQARGRLLIPAVVAKASHTYQDDRDVFAPFIEDACECSPGVWESNARLWEAYGLWATRSGTAREHEKIFGEGLTARGFEQTRPRAGSSRVRGRNGIRLNTEYAMLVDARDESAPKEDT